MSYEPEVRKNLAEHLKIDETCLIGIVDLKETKDERMRDDETHQ